MRLDWLVEEVVAAVRRQAPDHIYQLQIAEPLVDRCVTSVPGGFRLASKKLVVLSQGIERPSGVVGEM